MTAPLLPAAPTATLVAPSAATAPSAAPGDAAAPSAPGGSVAPSAAPGDAAAPSAPGGSVAPSAAPGDAAAPAPPSATTAPAPPSAPPAAPVACVEQLPEGRARPPLVETFPTRGKAGYAAQLVIEVQHLPGEQVLPSGLKLQTDSPEAQGLQAAQFALPRPDGTHRAQLERSESGGNATTKLTLPVVPLPTAAGRSELTLPPLPIAIARSSGEVFTVCTQPHTITVDEPLANEVAPEPRDNPPARRQLEVWREAQTVFWAALAALALGVLLAWLFTWWRRRPRKAPPPPPPRPPWEVALEALHNLERSNLMAHGRYAEYFERVSDALREYLGDRYGFEGLESTTREALRVLDEITPPVRVLSQIRALLQQADLVKFAAQTPSADECDRFMSEAREVVENTIPYATPPAAPESDTPPRATPPAAPESDTPPRATPPASRGSAEPTDPSSEDPS